ncbi:MAG: hypothetical protein LBR64_01260 [Dysgonamonadaceae bacterium]|jgi:hypothetical protein|nr:hypothetical protein [Dysgonamonadaceae bacterium]
MRLNWKTNRIECCGQHETCALREIVQKRARKAEVEYYDDEELDIFRGRTADSYCREETALFREVLETMLESDVPGWLESLKMRGIELPSELRIEN